MDKTTEFLIIGATGLIGRTLIGELNGKYRWRGTCFSKENGGLIHLDINDKKRIEEIFNSETPTHVIYCVNLSGGVDFCEKNPDLTRKLHFEGVVNTAKECLNHKTRFMFISSECVFDGKKESYDENDETNPLNIYGKYKVEAEKWIQANLKNYAIARTMSVYGWDPQTLSPNPLMQAYFSIMNKKRILVPVFRWANPIYVKDLAKAIVELSLSKESGLFHIAGPVFINRYNWLKKACKFLGWDSSFLLPLQNIPKNMVPRPYKIRLNTNKFHNKFKTQIHGIDAALKILEKDIVSENAKCKA